jgi:hypothetical protein
MLRSALAALALFAPASALASPLIVAPHEPMVRLEALPHLGASRLSSVLHCLSVAEAELSLITDSELETVEACLLEHT